MHFRNALSVLIATLVVACVIAVAADPAYADFLGTAESKIQQLYESMKRVVFIVGAIGIIVLAVFAFFGRFKWTTFFMIAGGIFLVGITSQLIAWLTQM